MDKATLEHIYKELILLDPSIKSQEKEVKRLIHNLLAIKPKSPFSYTYKENFKHNLLALIQEQKGTYKSKPSILGHIRLRIGGFATLSVFAFLIFYYQEINKRNTPDKTLSTITTPLALETAPQEKTTSADSLPTMSFAKQAQDTEDTLLLQDTATTKQEILLKTSQITLPTDKELITTIENLIGSKIDLSQYGDPIIKKDITQSAYMVIYPKTENNEILYDTNGNIAGIWINITPANSMINRIRSDGIIIYDGTKNLRK